MLDLYVILRILVSAIGIQCAPDVGTVVKAAGSTIHGTRCEHSASNAFLGIPYARPPIGDLRFASPQPAHYTSFIDATKQQPNCLQFGLAFIEPGPQSEDW